MAHHSSRVLILGSGAAGCTAAIYAARAGLSPLLVAGLQPGGQLTITTDVENFPGFDEVIQGPWLMERMQRQAEGVGTRFMHDTIVSVDLSRRPFVAVGDSGDVYSGDTLIVATGASARWLGLESETLYSGRGVSACATCDGFFFRGKPVVVVGGGNTAVEEALYLTNHASHVTLVHRRDALRAERVLQERLLRHPKVTVRWNAVVDEILGGGDPPGVCGVRLKDSVSGALETVDCEGVFIAIGHTPNTGLFPTLDKDDAGYLVTAAKSTATNVPGVFAAGDVQDPVFRQAVTAAGSGCMAALEAERFLAAHED
ncbi:thioredoxin-disulfide reductase [Pararhodospirillum photometricum]|nr:thioredoxin-disulfide reductase [Pararhodospirillum photometricum]